jgi:heme oxygenase
MATVPIERALADMPALPAWRPRAEVLAADLHALDRSLPATMAFAPPRDRAEALGLLYVLEGSRLGGAIIVERVPAGLPRGFLSSRHLRGEWRALLEQIDSAARDASPAAAERIVEGARRGFAAYHQAALAMTD